MNMRPSAGFLPLLLLAACTGGMSPDAAPAGAAPDPLAQIGRWALQGATDPGGRPIAAVLPGGRAVHALVFDGERVAVQGGCNHVGGRYRIEAGGRLRVLDMQSTLMACSDQALMDADAAVAGLLEGEATWRIAESYPEQLRLEHADGRSSRWVAERPAR
ncbi:META domain-containing protein [Luteimonas sp. RD2P54]|uniref:META domain-containing protein n=1 Tax=Luteimonas endophytica TaxID=3042023 RepID=A0ABT6JA42_9GAMM|nr:META domain-containing protein [Luteimonas endophytica]MDH5823690.1 META domain-containing protein [Luteimonas endophytica]